MPATIIPESLNVMPYVYYDIAWVKDKKAKEFIGRAYDLEYTDSKPISLCLFEKHKDLLTETKKLSEYFDLYIKFYFPKLIEVKKN